MEETGEGEKISTNFQEISVQMTESFFDHFLLTSWYFAPRCQKPFF